MIVDVFIWSYERDAVDIRLINLKGVVDCHVAVQATNTFRGEQRIVGLLDKEGVTDVVVTIPEGLTTWDAEKWLRDQSLTEARAIYGDDAIYMVCDGDEIPHPDAIRNAVNSGLPQRLITDYRNFYADWRANDHELAHQPIIGKAWDFDERDGACNARWYVTWPTNPIRGWHLSSLGTNDQIKQKMSTFAHSEYDTDKYRANLDIARAEMRDFLNRFELEHTNDIPKGVPEHLLGGER